MRPDRVIAFGGGPFMRTAGAVVLFAVTPFVMIGLGFIVWKLWGTHIAAFFRKAKATRELNRMLKGVR